MVNTPFKSFVGSLRKLQKTAVIRIIKYWHTLCQKNSEGIGKKKGFREEMKKGLVAIFCLLALMFTALPVSAQKRYRRFDNSRRYEQRATDRRYRDRDRVYDTRRRSWNRDRSFWDKHRDKITTGIGAGAGAAVGAAVGGKKGALLGAIIGGGGAAVYTYGIRDKDRRHRRY